MTDGKAREILKKHCAAYGDSKYEPARWVIEAMQEAVAAEREACAKVCEEHARGWEKNPGNNPMAGFIATSNCAGDIRARSNAGGNATERSEGRVDHNVGRL